MYEPSGAQWCSRFPGSKSIDDLQPTWRDTCLKPFLGVLTASGATINVAATYRPPERAYLMHFACLIAGYHKPGGAGWYQIDPKDTPFRAGVGIDWRHGGNTEAARAAARAMVAGYGIAFPAALVSRHTERLAIDMHVSWSGALTVVDNHGNIHTLTDSPHDGTNPTLAVVGSTFGVVKLRTDPPHWSNDGH